jgi:hypothetical protein
MSSSNNDLGTAEAVRRAFAALPLDERFTTLVKVQFDMLGDIAETIVSATSKVIDDLAEACSRPAAPAQEQPGTGTQA